MTTIVLARPNERCPRFQVFAVYDAPDVHRAFGLQETSSRDEAERVAHDMMEIYEADHFRRVVTVGERIG